MKKRSGLYKRAVARTLRSKKFLAWGRGVQLVHVERKADSSDGPQEEHYTPAQLGKLWGVSADTVRRLFEDEPGVLRIGETKAKKRRYILMRIPQTIAWRVHHKFSANI